MMKPDISQILHLIGNVKYVIFLIMGSYFIFQGNVIQKFDLKKTSFTEEVEYVSELPTIMITVICRENRSLKYGNDFSITVGKLQSGKQHNLSYGKNEMDGLPSLRLEPLSAQDIGVLGTMLGFLLVPLSSPSKSMLEKNPSFALTWSLLNTSDSPSKAVTIGMALSTENNSITCMTSKGKCVDPPYKDGSVTTFLLSPGQVGLCFVYAEKYIRLDETNKCRTRPYNQEVLNLSLKEMKRNCSFPCRPKMTIGTTLDEIIKHLPLCRNSIEVDCYDDAVVKAQKATLKEPCTKLEYRIDRTTYPSVNTNQAMFGLTFGSLYVSVKEQYVIYDLIAMIGAVGGTMGLCIGFSFNDSFNSLLTYLQMVVNWTKARNVIKTRQSETVKRVKSSQSGQDSKAIVSGCTCNCKAQQIK